MKECTIFTLRLEMDERIYTFMFINVRKKHTIYGKGNEDQRGTRRTLPKMAKTMNMEGMFFGDSKGVFSKHFCKKLHSVNSGQRADSFF